LPDFDPLILRGKLVEIELTYLSFSQVQIGKLQPLYLVGHVQIRGISTYLISTRRGTQPNYRPTWNTLHSFNQPSNKFISSLIIHVTSICVD